MSRRNNNSKSNSTQKYADYPIPKTCMYCGSEVILTSNSVVYGRKCGNGMCYKCVNCDSYVGVHPDLKTPYGILANAELRKLKKIAHAMFDPIWNKEGGISRTAAYNKLAIKLGIPTDHCHFGWFDKDMLVKTIRVLREGI